MTPAEIQLWLQLGLGGLAMAALALGARGVWVYGTVHKEALVQRDRVYGEMTSDRDRWRDMALRGINVAEKATTVAEKAASNGTTA